MAVAKANTAERYILLHLWSMLLQIYYSIPFLRSMYKSSNLPTLIFSFIEYTLTVVLLAEVRYICTTCISGLMIQYSLTPASKYYFSLIVYFQFSVFGVVISTIQSGTPTQRFSVNNFLSHINKSGSNISFPSCTSR